MAMPVIHFSPLNLLIIFTCTVCFGYIARVINRYSRWAYWPVGWENINFDLQVES